MEGEYFSLIVAVRCDSTGKGDFPTEYLQDHSGLPMDEESRVQFTSQPKNEMYTLFEAALFREIGDPLRFSCPADHPLSGEFGEHVTTLVRECTGNGEYLSPHAPETPGAHEDAPTMAALGSMGAVGGVSGDTVFA